jgi:PTS system cellobiose-specific IIC component
MAWLTGQIFWLWQKICEHVSRKSFFKLWEVGEMSKKNFLNDLSLALERSLMPLAMKISGQRHLIAVRNGIVACLPLTIIGGFMLVLASPPVDPETMLPTNILYRFLLGWYSFAEKHQSLLAIPFNMTMGIMVLFVVMGIAYSLSKSYKMSGMPNAVTAAVVYLMTTSAMESAVLMRNLDKLGDAAQDVIPASFLGGKGMISAIIIGLLTVEITRFFQKKNIYIKMPESVPPAIADSFASLVPFTMNLLIFYGIHVLLMANTGKNLGELILSVVTPALNAADSALFVMFVMFIGQLGWFFGIHDAATMWPIFNPLSAINLLENANRHLAGLPLDRIFTESFWSSFMAIGGSGSTLALLLLLLFSKVKHFKIIGRGSLIPSLFNINEPIIFGLPIFLNPIIGIPFIFIPVINTFIAFAVTELGFIGHTFVMPPWTTPSVLCAFLSTMDWRASVLVLVLIALDMMLYYPFFKIYEKQMLLQEGEEAR